MRIIVAGGDGFVGGRQLYTYQSGVMMSQLLII